MSAGALLLATLAGLALGRGPVLPAGADFLSALFLGGLGAALRGRGRAFCWLLAAVAAGHGWSVLRAPPPTDWFAQLGGRDWVVTGAVAGLPERRDHGLRFLFRVDSVAGRPLETFPETLLLDWYGRAPAVAVGERYRLTVRVRPWPGGRNPAGPDPAMAGLRLGAQARGYVRAQAGFEALAGGGGWQALRQRLLETMADRLEGHPSLGVVAALGLGVRTYLDESQWRVLLATGTNHLVAISGLHVGLVAGLVGWAVRRLWPWTGLAERWPAPWVAVGAALAAATGYAALAGFSVPTQRALWMLVLALGAPLLGRHPPPGRVLSLTALVVAAWDPRALEDPGAWLSFAAVAVLVYGFYGHLPPAGGSLWWRWGRAQWLVAVGLLPLLVGVFGQVSVVGPLANALAVPWTGAVVVPLVLLGVASALVGWTAGAAWCWRGAAEAWEGVWQGLEVLAAGGALALPSPPLWAWLAAAVGVVWALAPRGVPARWLALFWLAPLVGLAPTRPEAGAFRFTLWDAGNGLAAVVETRGHLLVYDTGDGRSGRWLAHWLAGRGWQAVDVLLLTRATRDHRGGARLLTARLPAREVWAVPGAWSGAARPCETEAWRWDGVRFQVLSGCVLLVENGAGRLLLSGDLRAATPPWSGSVQVLQVPDHGSLRGTDLSVLRPRWALVSVGPGNRWGHPQGAVVARYEAVGARWLSTAEVGAMGFSFPARGVPQRRSLTCEKLGFCAPWGRWLE